MIACQRSRFSLPDDLYYLNCASRAPMPHATMEAGRAALERQAVPRSLGPGEYFSRSEQLRENIACLVDTSCDRVAFSPAVSYGVAIAANNWPIRKGQTVVAPEAEFPSDVYGWIAACQRHGGVLRTVPRPRSPADIAARWSEAIMEAIDVNTAVVNLSTVHWTDGLAFDVDAIVRRAREFDTLVVIDGTQSLGAKAFSFDATSPDLLLCSSYKWLFGPYQIGFAVLGDRLLETEPFEHHWSNREGSADVTGTEYRHQFRDGARRFDVGAHANDQPISMLDTSIDMVREWGTEPVTEYVANLMEPLENYLRESPYIALEPSERCRHILGMRAADAPLMARAFAALAERNVRVSLRGDCLRVSPHVYNRAEDIAALLDGLKDAAK